MKFRIIFVLITFLVASCGIWKESGSNVSVEEDQTAPVRTGPVVYVYTGPEFSRASLLEPLIAEYDPEVPVPWFARFLPFPGWMSRNTARSFSPSEPTPTLSGHSPALRRDGAICAYCPFFPDDPVLLEYFSELVVDSAFGDELLTPESEPGRYLFPTKNFPCWCCRSSGMPTNGTGTARGPNNFLGTLIPLFVLPGKTVFRRDGMFFRILILNREFVPEII